uniref:Uncharacterized protein n=1 Tax=viral metagenome TaxID=1070528 RepID=A0A6C0BMJ6_9ZZZZ
MQVDFEKTRDGKYPKAQWPQLLHRKITPKFLDTLAVNYPRFEFEILTVFDPRPDPDEEVKPYRVRIFTDSDGVVIKIPVNG